MTGSAGTAESAVMTVRTGVAPKTCNSSPGNANLRIGTQAGQNEDRHTALSRSNVSGHTHNITDHTRSCHFSLPTLRPPSGVMAASPGVIPAQAGILTRDVIYKGHTVVNNHAGTPSRHQLNTECKDLCVLQPLVWIRTICRSRRPYPD